jgi:hypothetical protein
LDSMTIWQISPGRLSPPHRRGEGRGEELPSPWRRAD